MSKQPPKNPGATKAGGGRFLLGVEGELVLIFPRDTVEISDVLGRLSHGVDTIGIAHLRIDEAPSDGRVEQLGVSCKCLSCF